MILSKGTKVIVQGITGKHGRFHTKRMLDYGTDIVAGVTPGKGGQSVENIPVFDSVKDALKKHKATWSAIFVPAPFAKAAALEALKNSLNIIIITEGVPVHDTLEIIEFAKKRSLIVLGPNCPGMLTPGESKIGIIPGHICAPGDVAIVSRSGTLTYEIIQSLTSAGIGQRTIIGIGGDPVPGTDFIPVLRWFEHDDRTKYIVLVGEIGSNAEEEAATYIKKNISKPVIAYVAGKTAPQGKQMGHAGAIISGKAGTASVKIKALKDAGVKVVDVPSQISDLIKKG